MSTIRAEPALEFREAQPCVYVPISVPLSRWAEANALVPEVLQWILGRGIALAGPLFYRYWTIGIMDEPFDLEVGFPVADAVAGDGRVRAGLIPAGTYATLTHHGHPHGLHDTCLALERWGERQGVRWAIEHRDGRGVWNGRYEFYLSNPQEVPDWNDWETKVAYLTEG